MSFPDFGYKTVPSYSTFEELEFVAVFFNKS
jgi:hypothetical protein